MCWIRLKTEVVFLWDIFDVEKYVAMVWKTQNNQLWKEYTYIHTIYWMSPKNIGISNLGWFQFKIISCHTHTKLFAAILILLQLCYLNSQARVTQSTLNGKPRTKCENGSLWKDILGVIWADRSNPLILTDLRFLFSWKRLNLFTPMFTVRNEVENAIEGQMGQFIQFIL